MSQQHNDNCSARHSRTEPEFRAWRQKLLKRLVFVCILAIPIGLLMKLPVVSILGAIGVVVGWVKLKRI